MTEDGRTQLQHTALASPVRREMLRLIRASAEAVDAAQLAEQLTLHVTTSRFHLGQLEAAGLVVRALASAPGPGRPRVTFRAAPQSDEVLALRELAAVLTAALATDADGGAQRAGEAGRVWARQHPPAPGDDPASALVRVFGELGFDPALVDAALDPALDGPAPDAVALEAPVRIDLRDCPFRELAREHRSVVCSAHAGLMAGILKQVSGVESGAELTPFIEPELCVVSLHGAASEST